LDHIQKNTDSIENTEQQYERKKRMDNQFLKNWGMVQENQARAAKMLEYFPTTLSKSGRLMPRINPFFRDGPYEARVFYDETELLIKRRTYENFAEDWAYIFGAGLMNFCGKETSLVIGHDIREGSVYLHPFALKGSMGCGIQTIDAGLCTGPELSYLTNKYGWAFLNGTASHYRKIGFLGFKNGWPWGKPMYNNMRMTQIIEMAKEGHFNRTHKQGWQPKELPLKTIDATKEYVDACWKGFDPESLGEFKIAIEAFSSGGTKMYTQMFEGTQITTLDVRDFAKNPIVVNNDGGMISNPHWGFSNSYFLPCDPGRYCRPDPLHVNETWTAREAVIQHKCNLAVIADHDADRMGILDENGEWLSASTIDCLVYEQLAYEQGNTLEGISVFGDVRLSRVVKEMVTKLDGKMVIGEVGRPYVIDLFQTEKLDLGSEGSLHHNSKRMNGNEDPLYFLFMILKLMKRTGLRLSILAAKYNKYFNSGEFYILIRDDQDLAKYREWERRKRVQEGKYLTHTELTHGINVEDQNCRWGMRESYSEAFCKGYVESFVSRKHGVKVLNDLLDSLAEFDLYPANPFMNENNIQRLMAKNPTSPQTSIGEVMFMGI